MLTPEQAPQIAAVFEEMERAPARARRHRRPAPATSAAASTAASSARAGRRRSSRSRTGPIDAGHDPGADRALPRRLRAPLRQPLRVRAGAGRQLPGRARRSPSEKVEFTRRATRTRRAAAAAAADGRAPPPRGEPLAAAEYTRDTLPIGAQIARPGGDPRGALDDARLPGQVATRRPLRRARDRARSA